MATYGGEMEQKLMDMEAEMNRFEEEINTIQAAVESEEAGYNEAYTTGPASESYSESYTTGSSGNKFILGTKTYDTVQQQLSDVPLGMPPPPPPSHDYDGGSENGHYPGPPPGPPGPPGPPPPRMMPPRPPGFLPPQLRFRFHPPPMAPRGPPMRHGFMRPGSGPMPPRPLGQLRPQSDDIGPKAVYSSAPVIKKPEPVAPVKQDDLLAQFAAELAEVGEELTSFPSSGKKVPEAPKFGHKQAKAKGKKPAEATTETKVEGSEGPSQNVGGLTGYQGMPVDTYMEEPEPDTRQVQKPPKQEKKQKSKKFVRTAAGQTWEDESLADWDPDDFRVFCGDLGNEVGEELLIRTFSRYPTFKKAKVIRDKRTNKTRGYGFISFGDPNDLARAMREMNGKYVGNRPIKLRKSTWRERNIEQVRKKDKEKKRLGFR